MASAVKFPWRDSDRRHVRAHDAPVGVRKGCTTSGPEE